MPSRLASTICGPPASGPPGTAVVFPDPHRAWYLARFTGADDDSLLFTSPTGSAADSNFRRRVWPPPWLALAWLTFTFTISAMLATSWRLRQARTCAS